jgi:hypothetical protein
LITLATGVVITNLLSTGLGLITRGNVLSIVDSFPDEITAAGHIPNKTGKPNQPTANRQISRLIQKARPSPTWANTPTSGGIKSVMII